MSGRDLLPNLGAEEGDDWQAIRSEPQVETAARLWALLFSGNDRIHWPASSGGADSLEARCDEGWPTALGPCPGEAVFPWILQQDGPLAWLNTETIAHEANDRFGRALSGPQPDRVRCVDDKAFAIRAARELAGSNDEIGDAIEIFDPAQLESPAELFRAIESSVRGWPAWLDGGFTLKPRHGTSGRGRLAGRIPLDADAIRGARPRLIERGGALLEPWFERATDLSVALRIPDASEDDQQTTILGTLEMLASKSGVYRGHCGEVDNRGRVFSGHREDETLRGDAAALAERAKDAGFFGPCGVDAFSYRRSGRERLRSLVEFNARMTMGTVTIGLVRRALPRIREALELTPGARRGFLLTYLSPGHEREFDELVRRSGSETIAIDLSPETPPRLASTSKPVLLFAMDRERLRDAHRAIFHA